MISCNHWKVILQFVPLTGLHEDICVLRIGAVQAERASLHFSSMEVCMGKN